MWKLLHKELIKSHTKKVAHWNSARTHSHPSRCSFFESIPIQKRSPIGTLHVHIPIPRVVVFFESIPIQKRSPIGTLHVHIPIPRVVVFFESIPIQKRSPIGTLHVHIPISSIFF